MAAQAVGLLSHEGKLHGLATALEGAGDVAGRLDQRLVAGSIACDDEGFLALPSGVGPLGEGLLFGERSVGAGALASSRWAMANPRRA
jgi:hypothetical protein